MGQIQSRPHTCRSIVYKSLRNILVYPFIPSLPKSKDYNQWLLKIFNLYLKLVFK